MIKYKLIKKKRKKEKKKMGRDYKCFRFLETMQIVVKACIIVDSSPRILRTRMHQMFLLLLLLYNHLLQPGYTLRLVLLGLLLDF